MKIKLPSSIASSEDLTELLIELHDYSKWLSHESIKKNMNLKSESKLPILSISATELLHTIGDKKTINKNDLEQAIENIKKYIKEAPTITITLSAIPSNSLKSNLVSWCRDNLAPNILVNFRFNKILLGGMVIRCGSRIFDWSFRRQILASSNKMPEVLRNV